jgi:predicted Zn-dependent protease
MRSSRSLPIGIALILAVVGVVRYCGQQQRNPVTGEVQHVAMSPRQEVALGVHSARIMTQRYGGELRDTRIEPYVESVGQRLVQRSVAAGSPYRFDFHVLRDPQTVNAFALPGGQIFITVGLLRRMRTEAQLAGVLGHEIGHVIARHGAQHLAKQQLGQSLVTALSIGTYDPDRPGSGRAAALLAQAANQMVNLRFGRDDELESDRYGFDFIRRAGYDPRGIVELMRILESAGGGRQPEFLSTHPNPGNRVGRLKGMIEEAYPGGLPTDLNVGAESFRQNVLDLIPGSAEQQAPPY